MGLGVEVVLAVVVVDQAVVVAMVSVVVMGDLTEEVDEVAGVAARSGIALVVVVWVRRKSDVGRRGLWG
ncbi:putative extensin [Iris pallida]|uniref:Extensin n=1 Tax=Iris pallida TaxID=29817 RepID=A0AAX6G2U6_IRIPA|nr:putative extensin [Iris pallida]